MKRMLVPLLLALLLIAAGSVVWMLGQAEEQIARVRTDVMTLEYGAVGAVVDEGGALDQAASYASRLPMVRDRIAREKRDGRRTADYWTARYDALPFERDAGGALIERDPELLLLAANAVFRDSRLSELDRDAALDQLDAIVSNYADVLRSLAPGTPGDLAVDAAYNYELAARYRAALERARPGAKIPPPAQDVPASIHGHQGGPPRGADPNQFRIVVPRRSDERNQNPEGGQGQDRPRRG